MDSQELQKPVVEAVTLPRFGDCIPEVAALHYVPGRLTITLQFSLQESPVAVEFDAVRGFRVLDEGDLLEFWNPQTRAEGWLWSVKEGGWHALESLRGGFVSGADGIFSEFLLLGQNDCVSILVDAESKVRFNPDHRTPAL